MIQITDLDFENDFGDTTFQTNPTIVRNTNFTQSNSRPAKISDEKDVRATPVNNNSYSSLNSENANNSTVRATVGVRESNTMRATNDTTGARVNDTFHATTETNGLHKSNPVYTNNGARTFEQSRHNGSVPRNTPVTTASSVSSNSSTPRSVNLRQPVSSVQINKRYVASPRKPNKNEKAVGHDATDLFIDDIEEF